jgi:hypothetical protein
MVDNETNENVESDNESLDPTPSDMLGGIEEIENQLNVIKKPFEINWNMLTSEFNSEKNEGRRKNIVKPIIRKKRKKSLINGKQ